MSIPERRQNQTTSIHKPIHWFLLLVAFQVVIFTRTLAIFRRSWDNQALVKNGLTLLKLPSNTKKISKIRRACRYDGHCPIGMTCGIKTADPSQETKNDPPGECQHFPVEDEASSANFLNNCADACQAELEMDEHFFHEAWPIIQRKQTTSSLSQPRGCILDFIRNDEDNTAHWRSLHSMDAKFPSYEPVPAIVTWEQTRFRHMVRVDPVVSSKNDALSNQSQQLQQKQQLWRAYCTSPCESDNDCQTLLGIQYHDYYNNPKPWECVRGACQRNPKFWERDVTEPLMVLVTGASAGYLQGLRNLVASARYWAPNHRVVIYNLGGLNETEVKSWPNVIELGWPNGIPKEYPPHVHVGKIYAWKPVIIQETLKKYGAIFWLDAGSTLTGPITPVENILKRNGIFLVKGQDLDMRRRAHPATYQWFGFSKKTMKVGPHYGGGTQAHLQPSRFSETIVHKNAACALNKTCIRPLGANLRNHRFDQTTLSLCAYQPTVRTPHHTEYLANVWWDLSPNLTFPSYRFVYTARSASNFYLNLLPPTNYVNKGIVPVDWLNVNQTERKPIVFN